MMNYAGNEALRADVAALANSMCDLRATLNALESRYRYDAEKAPGPPDNLPHQRALS